MCVPHEPLGDAVDTLPAAPGQYLRSYVDPSSWYQPSPLQDGSPRPSAIAPTPLPALRTPNCGSPPPRRPHLTSYTHPAPLHEQECHNLSPLPTILPLVQIPRIFSNPIAPIPIPPSGVLSPHPHGGIFFIWSGIASFTTGDLGALDPGVGYSHDGRKGGWYAGGGRGRGSGVRGRWAGSII